MFILFFGTRPGKSQTRVLEGVPCDFCKQRNTLTASITPNYFHIFWLPIFTVSTTMWAECSHCRRRYFKDEFTPAMEQALK